MSDVRRAVLPLLVIVVALSCSASDPPAPSSPPKSAARPGLVEVVLPDHADGLTTVRDRGSTMALRFRLEGASHAPGQLDGELRRFPAGGPDGSTLTLRRHRGGVEDLLTFAAAPSHPIGYELTLDAVAGLRQTARALELLDAAGTPRLRVLAPWVRDAEGATHRAGLTVLGCAFDDSPRPPWGRPVTAPGADRCRLEIAWPSSVTRYPATLDPAWVSGEQMDQNRFDFRHSYVGQDHPECGDGPFVVVSGGFRLDNGQARRSVEIYHPETGTWCAGPELRIGRARHSSTFIDTTGSGNDGAGPRLVLVGGLSFFSDGSSFIASSEILSLETWTWIGLPGTIYIGRADHQGIATSDATNAPEIALIGGNTAFGRTAINQFVDPQTGYAPLFKYPQALSYARAGITLDQLGGSPDRYLVTGGCSLSQPVDGVGGAGGAGGGGGGLPNAEPPCEPWEIYCPKVGCPGEGDEIPKLLFHDSVRTNDAVVVAGGVSLDFETTDAVWSFDRVTEVWSPLPALPTPRRSHRLDLLADGTLLVAGGVDESGDALAGTLRLAPGAGAWTDAGELTVPRWTHGSQVLPDGAVFLFGGEGAVNGETELYIPCSGAGDCPEGTYCSLSTGACAPLESDGTPCTDGTPCFSGLCVDGVCCNSACSGAPCEACNLPGSLGLCTAVPTAEAPTECLPIATCADAVTFVDQEGEELDCTPYRCQGAACLDRCNASADCADGFVCNAAGTCVSPPAPEGGSCSVASANRSSSWPWLVLAAVALRSRRASRRRARRR